MWLFWQILTNFDDIPVIVKLSPSHSNWISIDQTKTSITLIITTHQPTHSPTPTQESKKNRSYVSQTLQKIIIDTHYLIQGKLEYFQPFTAILNFFSVKILNHMVIKVLLFTWEQSLKSLQVDSPMYFFHISSWKWKKLEHCSRIFITFEPLIQF